MEKMDCSESALHNCFANGNGNPGFSLVLLMQNGHKPSWSSIPFFNNAQWLQKHRPVALFPNFHVSSVSRAIFPINLQYIPNLSRVNECVATYSNIVCVVVFRCRYIADIYNYVIDAISNFILYNLHVSVHDSETS